MKHSLTAVLAVVSAAGLAGIAQAQTTTTPPAAAPAPGVETMAPSTQDQSSTAPASQSAAQPTTAATAPKAAPTANMQQSRQRLLVAQPLAGRGQTGAAAARGARPLSRAGRRIGGPRNAAGARPVPTAEWAAADRDARSGYDEPVDGQ